MRRLFRFTVHCVALVVALTASLTVCSVAYAHAPGEHYIWLSVDDSKVHGNVEINVTDLANLPGISIDPDATLTDEMLAPHADTLISYVTDRFGISANDTPLTLALTGVSARSFDEGNFAQVAFQAPVTREDAQFLSIRDEMLYEVNPRHRGLLMIVENAAGQKTPEGTISLVFNGNNAVQTVDVNNPPGLLNRLQFVWQGILHIWFGFDHVLFLLSLLLTSVLVRQTAGWRSASNFKSALWSVLKIVTVFTLAHSVTLLLAALDYAKLPSQFVESVIALSIIVAALSNIIGRFDSKKLLFVLAFGLFHGLGFASVMADLPFRMENILSVVLFFNLGVELGQIAIVAVVFPLLYAARNTSWYVPVIVKGGSALLILIAAYWLFQRVTGVG